jgi:hypothetical protein
LISIDEDVLGKEISQTVLPRNKYEKVKQVLKKYHREVHRDVIDALTTYFRVSIERESDGDRDREVEKKKQNAKKRKPTDDVDQDDIIQEGKNEGRGEKEGVEGGGKQRKKSSRKNK